MRKKKKGGGGVSAMIAKRGKNGRGGGQKGGSRVKKSKNTGTHFREKKIGRGENQGNQGNLERIEQPLSDQTRRS